MTMKEGFRSFPIDYHNKNGSQSIDWTRYYIMFERSLIFIYKYVRPDIEPIARTQMIADRSEKAERVSPSIIINYEDLLQVAQK